MNSKFGYDTFDNMLLLEEVKFRVLVFLDTFSLNFLACGNSYC